MTKEKMLSIIYNEMADKTLSEGCKYITDIYKCTIRYNDVVQPDNNMLYSKENDDFYRIYIIIGHPVRIGNVLDWFDKGLEIFLDVNNDKGHDIYKDIIALWSDKKLPIDEQSDECIEFVYNLIKK